VQHQLIAGKDRDSPHLLAPLLQQPDQLINRSGSDCDLSSPREKELRSGNLLCHDSDSFEKPSVT
jgi:hypothetical protein